MRRVETLIAPLDYDACVLTGDYRALTSGPYNETLERMGTLCSRIRQPIYAVLGNHDTIRMVPALEDMGIRVLLNEADTIERDGEKLHVAGIDDAHYFRVDNMEKAADGIPLEDFSILLSHTPEVYRQAAHAGFDLMLSGHTHAGQICLPGQIPVKLNAVLPRRFGAGAWMHGTMHGYTSSGVGTSIVTARFNCPPEITLHRLECE
jgi:predicted MPP superfamily phosphohydrolase